MSIQTETSALYDNAAAEFSPQWGDDAPRGGRTVLQRILKDGAAVPLFLGQTLVNSLRDMGYNSTTSALCETLVALAGEIDLQSQPGKASACRRYKAATRHPA
jgi:hypothetical protein